MLFFQNKCILAAESWKVISWEKEEIWVKYLKNIVVHTSGSHSGGRKVPSKWQIYILKWFKIVYLTYYYLNSGYIIYKLLKLN